MQLLTSLAIGGQRHRDLFIGLTLALLSFTALMALTSEWPTETDDAMVHFYRVLTVGEALRDGVIYPRWFPESSFGYGDPLLNFYPPAFYFPAALLHVAGLDVLTSVRIVIAVGFALSAWWMFGLTRLFATVWPAIICVICYQLYPYRLYNLFFRGAFPELFAFVWLPAFAMYALRIATSRGFHSVKLLSIPKALLFEDSKRRISLILAGLAFAAMVVTHSLTALMTAISILAVGILSLPFLKGRNEYNGAGRVFIIVVIAMAVGALLSAWYSVPLLAELRWTQVGQGYTMSHWKGTFGLWGYIFDLGFPMQYGNRWAPARPVPVYSIPVAIAVSFCAFASREARFRLFALVALVTTIFSIWMTTRGSEWLWHAAEGVLEKLQFTWRFLVLAGFGTSLMVAASLEALRFGRKLPGWAYKAALVLSTAFVIYYSVGGLSYSTEKDEDYPDLSATSLRRMTYKWDQHWPKEFRPSWVETDPLFHNVLPDGELQGSEYLGSVEVLPTRAGFLRQEFVVSTEQDFRLLFHQYFYPAWQVTIDGERAAVEPAGRLSLVSVQVPSGSHELVLYWGATRAVWIGRTLTALGWLVVFLLIIFPVVSRRRGKGAETTASPPYRDFLPAAAWLVFGAVIVVVSSGMTSRTWNVTPVEANYGGILLEAVRDPPPTHAGEVAPVQLYWMVTGAPTPVKAFVHLVDETGLSVTQADVNPGGDYTPFQRWEIGQLLTSTHKFTVPESLPPGSYRLIAGLYYPDNSHEPLKPLNLDASRIEIGSLDVLPRKEAP